MTKGKGLRMTTRGSGKSRCERNKSLIRGVLFCGKMSYHFAFCHSEERSDEESLSPFTEFTLRGIRFFASLRMTIREGLRVTKNQSIQGYIENGGTLASIR